MIIAVVLCGGQGKRMGSDVPKPLVEVAGTPLLVHLIQSLDSAWGSSMRLLIVIPPTARQLFLNILSKFQNQWTLSWELVPQEIPKGTGHAFQTAWSHLLRSGGVHRNDRVLCLNGDVPFVPIDLLRELGGSSESGLVAFNTDTPSGYGRILVEPNGSIRIVEEKDCEDDTLRKTTLVNAGAYVFLGGDVIDVPPLFSMNNAQQEMYLTEYIPMLQRNGKPTRLFMGNQTDLRGANTPEELRVLESLYISKCRVSSSN